MLPGRLQVHTLQPASRALSLAVLIAACSASESDTTKRQPPRVTSDAPARMAPAPLPVCAATGHWESCTVFDRLTRAGLAPQRADSIRVPFLRVAGETWRLGAATIHVFRYRDSVTRQADFSALDSARARPAADTLTSWSGTPTTLVNDNLLAILLSDNAEQVERVTLALTAGPPPKATSAVPESP